VNAKLTARFLPADHTRASWGEAGFPTRKKEKNALERPLSDIELERRDGGDVCGSDWSMNSRH
jgi:hypothetical protein